MHVCCAGMSILHHAHHITAKIVYALGMFANAHILSVRVQPSASSGVRNTLTIMQVVTIAFGAYVMRNAWWRASRKFQLTCANVLKRATSPHGNCGEKVPIGLNGWLSAAIENQTKVEWCGRRKTRKQTISIFMHKALINTSVAFQIWCNNLIEVNIYTRASFLGVARHTMCYMHGDNKKNTLPLFCVWN